MATPASSGHAFHHRFDAVPAKDVPSAIQSHMDQDHLEYPDLDAGHIYSSASTYTVPAPAPSKLPDFPEFTGLDSQNDLFTTNNFFQQYSAQPVASAALVEPQSAQIEGSPQADQLESTSAHHHHHQPAQDPPESAPQANHAHSVPQASAHPNGADLDGQSQQQQQAQESYQPQLERHFSSASSYVQQPSLHRVVSHESHAPSHHSHDSHRSPLPRPPSVPTPPQIHTVQPNVASNSQSAQPRSPPEYNAPQTASPFSFPAQNGDAAGTAQTQPASQHMHQQPASPQSSLPQPEALNMPGLRIDEPGRSADQQPTLQPANTREHENGDRIRPSSFFGMQRPAAALNSTGQHVPVPPTMLADDDGFYQDQQHLSQSNGSGQPQQRNQDALNQGPRPSSFFGIEGDSASSIQQPESAIAPNPLSEVSAPEIGAPSSQRAESAPRGISTAAGGTGNGPMPGTSGFGGLGPAGANRPASIAPSVASGPLLDHSHLRVGQKASLLSHGKTLELYRQNAKKTNDPNLIYELAVFMIDAAKTMGTEEEGSPLTAVNGPNKVDAQKEELVKEATGLLKKIADRGHPDAQYFLADCFANGIGTRTGKQDFGQAYTYFVLAAKHGHPDAAYRAGTCYEKGWGCRKDAGKALQFYRKSAAQNHPGAMYRLATAELNGELSLRKNAKEGVKWLKRSAEAASPEFPHALHELALLHERGIDNVLFVDPEYSCELLAQAGEMGYAPSAYKLGVNYEYGRMGCPQDGGLSIHMYNIAAQQNHKEACFALTAWYLVGAPGILPQSDTEAYLWAKKAAEQGLAKAEYAVGYFTEMGIGTVKDINEARAWYKRAADHGDKRANQRIAALQGRGGPTGLAGIGALNPAVPASSAANRQQQRQDQKQEQRESMAEFGRRAQPTSAPFPSSVTQSSMTPSTQMNYPSPLAMREAQTAQREQQYLANVAANERAQARAMLRHSPSQQEIGSPVSSGPPGPGFGLPRPPSMQQQQQQPNNQPQAYPSYPMSAGAAVSPTQQNGQGRSPVGGSNPMFPPSAPGRSGSGGSGGAGGLGGPVPNYGGPGSTMVPPPTEPTPPAKADFGNGANGETKKKKGWFGRS
ncbi:related to SKT5 - protoplast regeneration and killer toxin resistance protein [Melanopsichium pennsylvanicum]|uniref:Related to SKT5 - protoplast regeneration and killer toxin resistance protein n=2 Tax=Melanopsichium pennsylvanicum TaxID=63383 RepID=A0AAJ4XMS1_9BASI|nr:related to SKT5-protoplast regeneration and killer toxin resistance protein [Melanopsichium pennsylvanicum 4]SNX85023.1 related to SKT5 - protoplast regeneration and killer toxin resistance protein [Melanopsichium pennsylvanicum]